MKNNTHIHIYTHLYFFRFFSIVNYKKIAHSTLCYPVGLFCSSILYIVVYIC